MQSEYKILTQSLQKYYIIKSLIVFAILVPIMVYFNASYSLDGLSYDDMTNHGTFQKLNLLIQATTSTINTIQSTINHIITHNYTHPNNSFYCTSDMNYNQCAIAYQNKYTEIIQIADGTSTSFRCLVNECLEIVPLWDYLWTFKIRMSFVDSFLIRYSFGDAVNSLVVPVLAAPVLDISALQLDSHWKMNYNSGMLTIGKKFTTQQGFIQIAAVYNSEIILTDYQLDLNVYNFGKDIVFQQNVQILTQYDGTVPMFQLGADVTTFTLLIYPYNGGLVLALIVSCLYLIYQIRRLTKQWEITTFRHLKTLDSLYKYQLNQMFQGQKPKNSAILVQRSITFFYEQLCEIIDKQYEQLQITPVQMQKQEHFKFTPLIDRILNKFQDHIKPLNQIRSRQLNNFKYLIKTSISQISQSTNKKLKQLYSRSKELHLTKAFFHYGYLSLLLTVQKYDRFLEEDSLALPEAMVSLFRYMNHTVNSNQIRYAFKFAFMFDIPLIEEQLIMKIHFNLLQKYYISLKQLDFGLNFAKQLKLQRDLKYLQQTIQNKKYIFITYIK